MVKLEQTLRLLDEARVKFVVIGGAKPGENQ
jgi:hypothetical protein